MKYLFIYIFLFANLFILSAQNTFKEGSYIDNSGTKISGQILNIDWLNNPSSITFKVSITAKEEEIGLDQIQSFELTGISRYERHTIQVDHSLNDINTLSIQRAPEFKEETVLLQIIADGAATLYEYSNNSLFRYYYKIESQPLTGLIYKRYAVDGNKVQTNNRFKQQLTILSCDKEKLPKIDNLRYRKGPLMEFFNIYNDCKGNRMVSLSKAKKTTEINIKVFGGISSSQVSTLVRTAITNFPNKVNPTFGIEVEGLLPFNNKKWGLFASFNSLKYNGEKEGPLFVSSSVVDTKTVDYSATNMSIGARHYMFINSDQKLFLDVGYGFEVVSSFKASSYITNDELSVKTPASSIQLGIGYAYKRLSLEARYIFERNHLRQSFLLDNSEYTAFMLTLGYKFLSF